MNPKQALLKQLETLLRDAAATELMPRFRHMERQFKTDGSIVTEADHACQEKLTRALQQQWPEIALLGEEMSKTQQQSVMDNSQNGLWVLDPLDGTSNFAAGIPCFSISLALLIDHQVQLGLIYDPIRKECFSAIAGEGAWLNGEPLNATEQTLLPLNQCMAQIDFKRLPQSLAAQMASHPPYSSQRSFGSGALDWCWLAAGRVQVYLHGKQKLWDYSAGQLILTEAGGQSCTLEGEAVFHNSLTPRSVIGASHTGYFDVWQEAVSAALKA
ncbi:MAG: inositol monophosphatase family protein [Gammaproteobacteria bacterium]|nr:inositol monophosphatase family protein [Gammaproteobacteria bacterium]